MQRTQQNARMIMMRVKSSAVVEMGTRFRTEREAVKKIVDIITNGGRIIKINTSYFIELILNIIQHFLRQINKQNQQGMSIYSGFATRQQQQTYDGLVTDLLFVLQKRILKFYQQQPTDELKFFDIMMHLHSQLTKMQQHKYLQPKTSKNMEELLKYLINNTEGIQHYLEHKKKNIEEPKAVVHPVRSANHMPLKKLTRTHRDSFSQLNEPTSIGKIIRQINHNIHDGETSQGDSRHKIIGNGNNSEDIVQTPRNPQDCQSQFDEISKKLGVYKSRTAKNKQGTSRPKDLLLQYLERNNKNYLRGYRKRSVKTRNFSTSGKSHNL